jgi:hypothetical protein
MTDAYKPQDGGAGKGGAATAGLADQAKALGRDLKAKASDLGDTVTHAAKDQAAEIGTAAKDMAAEATGRVKSAMNEQKTASADYLGTIAGAVQRAAGEFDGAVPQAAQYIRQAAGQIETVANAVRERDVRELLGEVQEFARRQPTLFFGGAVVLGFAALRFFKSSAPGASQDSPARSNVSDASGARPGNGSYTQSRPH